MMIPKIFHQTWKDANIKDEYLPFAKKLKEVHPDWEYKLWTDIDN